MEPKKKKKKNFIITKYNTWTYEKPSCSSVTKVCIWNCLKNQFFFTIQLIFATI